MTIQPASKTRSAFAPYQQSHNLDQLLLDRFGYRDFRPLQREVIESVLEGKSSLAVLPTGGGKSLCYQLPALILPGITLVISPLISLMKDQVDDLVARKIAAVSINSQDTSWEMERKLADIQNGQVHLVYVAPERLKNAQFIDTCRRAQVSLIAVDEAHCVSQWGHDFRPDYRFIRDFHAAMGKPTLLALTATATRRVQKDIAVHLGIADAEQFLAAIDRPNLWLGMEHCTTVAEKRGKIATLVGRATGSTIVYVSSRKDADELAALLERVLEEPVLSYHAGLLAVERTSVQNRFMSGLVRVVVATNAFGMGIDKADIRAVIHATVPDSIEAYFQEVGRAGRDGGPAECTMVVVPGMDVKMREYLMEKDEPTRSQVDAMLRRVAAVLKGQSEGIVPMDERDGTLGTLVLAHLQALGSLELLQRTTSGMRVRGLVPRSDGVVPCSDGVVPRSGGSAPRTDGQIPPADGMITDQADQVWERVMEHVRTKRERFRRARSFVYLGSDVCRREFILQYFGGSAAPDLPECCSACQPRPVAARRLTTTSPAKRGLSSSTRRSAPALLLTKKADPELLDALKEWRRMKANERAVPAYVIFGDRDLEGIAAARPRDLDELAACRGIGPMKLKTFGEEILSVIAPYNQKEQALKDQLFACLEQGKSLPEISAELTCDPAFVFEQLLDWVTHTQNEIWKSQVRRLISPDEYVAIRRVLRAHPHGLDITGSIVGREYDKDKIALTRAVMRRVGDLQ